MDEVKKQEIMAKAREAASAEDLIKLAKTYGVDLSEDAAAEIFNGIHTNGEIADDELVNISGGKRRGHRRESSSSIC